MKNEMPKLPAVPELEKIKLHQAGISTIIYFMGWCEGSGSSEHTDEDAFDSSARLAKYDDSSDELFDVRVSIELVAWRYYGIDAVKVEEERRALLDYQRALNDRSES